MSSYESLTTGISKRSRQSAKYLALLALVGVSSLAYLACIAFTGKTTTVTNSSVSLASFYPPLANPGELNLYEHGNFQGRKLTLRAGFKGNMDDFNFNDMMSSLQIGQGLRVKFCEHQNCKGNEWHNSFELLGPYNAPHQAAVQDWVSYIEVYRYDPEVEPRVLLLGTGNFDFDLSGTFKEGRYSSEDLKRRNIDKPGYPGSASGIVVPSQLRVTVYMGDWFQGESYEFNGPFSADFDRRNGEFSKWNDKIASMIVVRRDAAPIQVTGFWKKVISNNDEISQTVTVSAGIDTSKTNAKEISASMTVGVEFGSKDLGYVVKMSATAGVVVRNTVQDTLRSSSSTSITAACKNPERVKVTLWQWQMTGVREGEVIMNLLDNEFMCKTGDRPPICPVGFCINADCTKCLPYT